MVDSSAYIMEDMTATDAAFKQLRQVQRLLLRNRKQGLMEQNNLFREGRTPETPLHGSYTGELVALDLAPGFTEFFE